MFLRFNRLNEEIRMAKSILFVCHKNPDPDTVGGALSLGAYAESLDKKISYFCKDAMPENFFFLSGVQKFNTDFEIFSGAHDLVIFIDCAELSRSGLNDYNFKKQNWILIDHHPAREEFTDLEIRDAGASSTCEIIYKFLLHAKMKISREMATALLAGLAIDTSFLSNAATNVESVRAAAELVSLGADYRAVVRAFHLNKCDDTFKLWGLALSRLKYDKEKNAVTTAIFKDDLEGNKNFDEMASGLSGFINRIVKSNMIMVLEETAGGVRGSLRSNDDGADVAKIAAGYGGGGHARAAGFTYPGRIIEKENEWGVEKN